MPFLCIHILTIMADSGFGKKQIWQVFGILLIITAIEFVIAFTLSKDYKLTRNFLFIALTIVKAFYIMAYFMHLKFERSTLVLTIIIPVVFIMGLIVALLFEGNTHLHANHSY